LLADKTGALRPYAGRYPLFFADCDAGRARAARVNRDARVIRTRHLLEVSSLEIVELIAAGFTPRVGEGCAIYVPRGRPWSHGPEPCPSSQP